MRAPDPTHKVPKKLIYGIGAGLVGVMIIVTYHNYATHQQDEVNDEQLAKMSAQNAATRKAALSPTATGPASTRSALEIIKHQDDIDLVMRRGWELINRRDPKSAEVAAEIFRDAIRDIQPDFAQFYNGLGRASLIMGKPNDAIEAFRKGLQFDPTIADMQSGIGWAYWQLHQPYYAKRAWEDALLIDPNSADAWSAMAWIYLAFGQNALAKRGFVILIARDSTDNYAVQGLSMSRSGVQANLSDVRRFFPLPDLRAFDDPPATAPATGP